MKYLIRPLPKKMIAQLQRGRAIELSKTERNICYTDDFNDTLPELYKRGLVDIKMVTHNDKEILSVYITKPGINFLDRYEQNQNRSGNMYNIN